ncbi:helix-turn-helix transcriptional regulator [Kibdelosporangium philippinense]|uniref:Helix-turn-helix transcriptional regulator n=1 Tax=Kibdelosporangium philippinense TaxID=211113 RepID=A0ABS8Z2I1_9PSEU|nr:helix-turn-helix transcriptional regulator [Kibdelosporangium philippinense]MCE7001637.1 helix-turn-helix transcriptional regulator [Kibdelosporangium philippinense]
MTTFEHRRLAFGNKLREIRESAGLNGTDLANVLGWQQSKVSKIERGRQTASDSDVVAWLGATNTPESLLEQMRTELRDLQVAQLTWRRQIREGHLERQQQGVRDAQSATTIRAVDIMAVPGLLQTPDYARAIFRTQADLLGVPDDDIEDAVAARMARQQVLYDRSKHIEILLAEAALSHPVCTFEELAGQVDRLVSSIGLAHVRIGILPMRRPIPHLLPHGFWIMDDEVHFESVSGEHRITDPDEIALYNKLTDRLWTAAVEGDQARALLLRTLKSGDQP